MNLLELITAKGLNPKRVSSAHGGEYHSACPACGGKDRFITQPNKQQGKCVGYYFCRQCGTRGDAIQFLIEHEGLSWSEAIQQLNIVITERKAVYQSKPTRPILTTGVQDPPSQWKVKAAIIVDHASQEIMRHPEILEKLNKRGLPIDAVMRYRIGYVPEALFQDREDWGVGLDVDENGQRKKIWVPRGILIPSKESNGDIVRLKSRRTDRQEGDKWPKYVVIPGSMNGLNIIGNASCGYMVIVESELDGYAIHYAAGDLVFVIAVGSNTKNQDHCTDYYAKKSKKILICHDNDDGGRNMLIKWSHYPNAQPYLTPIGKDIGEAIEQGLDIRTWLLQSLPAIGSEKTALGQNAVAAHGALEITGEKTNLPEQGWSKEDQELISAVMPFVNQGAEGRLSPYPDPYIYLYLKKEIGLGPNGSRAQTRALQDGLRFICDEVMQ
jgi:hypothetical protein